MIPQTSNLIPRSAKPLSLANLTPQIFDIIHKNPKTTFAEVADLICQETQTNYSDLKTLRRRVYDVLNVLCAANFVSKEGKVISFNSPQQAKSIAYSDEYRNKKAGISMRLNELQEQVKTLLFYKLLVERNRNRPQNPKAVHLPSIIMTFDKVDDGSIQQSIDSKKLTIVTKTSPNFFSPLHLCDTLFPIEQQIAILRQIPSISKIEETMFPNFSEQQLHLNQPTLSKPSQQHQQQQFMQQHQMQLQQQKMQQLHQQQLHQQQLHYQQMQQKQIQMQQMQNMKMQQLQQLQQLQQMQQLHQMQMKRLKKKESRIKIPLNNANNPLKNEVLLHDKFEQIPNII
ncbi:hypothetical protein TRFO_36136 [Tritrichomonas foetus]|uniref:E2F/DP family winged-helix DNA-binding domain-containing protein n=1 Tax=Tritrichomonas foetus TaxID=1144522 RepID=A0A1J4JEH9_9EUKA|nr:hypothetical protein TRFO_36136 [Tritrichomonas foetus]|eukprot:OHS97598.1 hypothetical protein TRFO_36136 [Tritrichomonas foetus]